jgi:peptidoglycan/LPS O-acetylase OafA/YrhL
VSFEADFSSDLELGEDFGGAVAVAVVVVVVVAVVAAGVLDAETPRSKILQMIGWLSVQGTPRL